MYSTHVNQGQTAPPSSRLENLTEEEEKIIHRSAAHEQARRGLAAAFTYMWAIFVVFTFTPVMQDLTIPSYLTLVVNALALSARIVFFWRFDTWFGAHPKLWNVSYDIAVWSAGLTWGLLSALAFSKYGTQWYSFVIVVITMAMCGGAFTTFAMRFSLAAVFFLVILLPLILVSFSFDGAERWALTITFSVWLIYCIYQAKLANRIFFKALINAIRLDAEAQRRLHELTYIDSLTGLPNRNLFTDRLQQALADARRENRIVGVLSIDIDQFMKLNDTLGQTAGDELLKITSQRLRHMLRASDTVARITADQYSAIVSSIETTDDTAKVAGNLLAAVHKPIDLAGLDIFPSISIGIAIFPQDGTDPESLRANAEAAMLRSRANGGNTFRFFESEMNNHAMKRLTLESQLQRALEREEFILHYQPKVSLRDGKIKGCEALVRWQPKEGGLVPPSDFIPLLEDTGLIVPVGEWILRTACAQNVQWKNLGFGNLSIAVNLSVRQFRDCDIRALLTKTLNETLLDPRQLEIEITESLLMENTSQIQITLSTIREMGVGLSIDDFGTGYSSLSYLKRMPIETVKIDRSFINDVTTDSSDAALVEAVIAMAQSLKLKVVAEGVETNDQVKFLRHLECDEIQGYYFSKPLPELQLRDLLEKGKMLPL